MVHVAWKQQLTISHVARTTQPTRFLEQKVCSVVQTQAVRQKKCKQRTPFHGFKDSTCDQGAVK